jgi:hypothetical protein
MEFRDEKQATKMKKQAIKSQNYQAVNDASRQTALSWFAAFFSGWAGSAFKNGGFKVVC